MSCNDLCNFSLPNTVEKWSEDDCYLLSRSFHREYFKAGNMISNNSGIFKNLSAITIKMVQDCTAVSEICDANGKTMWKTKCVVKPYISVIK